MAKDQYRAEVIDPGDQASRLAKEICQKSQGNCRAVRIISPQPGRLRSPDGFVWKKHILEAMTKGEMWQIIQNDGAGGKPQFFTLLGNAKSFRQLGWEIITMNADDIARFGGLPCVMANEIQVQGLNQNNLPLFRTMMEGYGEALSAAHLVNITGEIAVMKHSVTAFCADDPENQLILTWGGTCIGLMHKDRLIDGSRIEPEMPIVGFREDGYRCNGGTFFTNLILAKFGTGTKKLLANPEVLAFVEPLTMPSRCYTPVIKKLLGWQTNAGLTKPMAEIVGIAHITGGGIWSKLGEILPQGVGAKLDTMPTPPEILKKAQKMSEDTDFPLTDWQAYSTFHGGCGMLVVCKTDEDARTVIRIGRKEGISASLIGHTTTSPQNEITIKSRFSQWGKLLSSLHPE